MSHAYDSDSDADSFHSAHDVHHDGLESNAEESTEPATSSSHQPVVHPLETAQDETKIASDTETRTNPHHPIKPTTFPSTNPTPNPNPPSPPRSQDTGRLSPTLEATLLTSSHASKSTGNALFSTSSFSSAIQSYDRALADCPAYLDYEIAVLRANIAACHLKLEEWKEAVEQATQGLEGLERLDPLPKVKEEGREEGEGGKTGGGGPGDRRGDVESGRNGTRPMPARPAPAPKPASTAAAAAATPDVIEELDETSASALEAASARLSASGHTLPQVHALRNKCLLRRATASVSLNTWTSLQAAETDYRLLLSPALLPSLSSLDEKTVRTALRGLGPRLDEAKKKEVDEMMGKLKELGNGILKPFGLSTDMFKFEKGEGGGYSMNFEQGGGKK